VKRIEQTRIFICWEFPHATFRQSAVECLPGNPLLSTGKGKATNKTLSTLADDLRIKTTGKGGDVPVSARHGRPEGGKTLRGLNRFTVQREQTSTAIICKEGSPTYTESIKDVSPIASARLGLPWLYKARTSPDDNCGGCKRSCATTT